MDLFNEPTLTWWKADGKQEGCHFSVATQAKVIKYLDIHLKNRGLSTMIAAFDESCYDGVVKTFQSIGSSALSKINRINVHGYQYARGNRAKLRSLATNAGMSL